MAPDIARIHTVSAIYVGIKCNFGIQVPKGNKNIIEFDMKNRNYL
jgi:hypothetical protein